MMVRRKQMWAMGGLWLFVVAMILVPLQHHLELSQADGHHACGGCGCHARHDFHADGAHRNETGKEKTEDQHRHEPDTCPICRLAKMPVDTAVVAAEVPTCGPAVDTAEPFFAAPVFTAPRFLPFSRGPPA